MHACIYAMLIMHMHTASEYRSWTLLYAVPVLQGILDEDTFNHFSKFVEALWLLLQSSITPNDLERAEKLFKSFCSGFSGLYGQTNYNN